MRAARAAAARLAAKARLADNDGYGFFTSLGMAATVFYVTSGVCQTLAGFAVDRFGARRIFMIAMVLFALSSAACGFAQDLNQLVVARR